MRIRTLNFLPEIFQTPTNKQFLNATLDQLVNGPELHKIEGYIGSRLGYGINANDYYVTEPNKTRTDYQLDPGVIFTKPNETVAKDFLSYPGILDALKLQGGIVDNNSSLFSAPFYSWDSFCNLDTLINYNEYYWLAEGPPAVIVKSGIVYPDGNYIVTNTNATYNFQVEGNNDVETNNPTITLLRGGSYTFEINQDTDFWIQGEPGVNGTSLIQPNLNVRNVLGVTNNGTQSGTITFDVPLKNAQNEYNFPTSLNVDLVCTLPYTSVNGQTLSSIGGSIDGVTSLNGLNILFYDTGSGNPAETTNFYTITTSGSTSNPTITLSAGTAIPTNVKLNVQYGTTYLGRSFYRSVAGVITLIPYLSAELDTLYYQDGTEPSKVGIIKLVESNLLSRINVDTEILGRQNYTSPNGVVFTNGLKVIFDGDIFPTSYSVGEYYVQGVGSSIELVKTSNLVNFEAYTSNLPSLYDLLPFDIGNFDFNLNVPTEPDYITIARNAINNNPWSRSNRWFHIDVIKATAEYNNDPTIVTTYGSYENKAKRPIIEFYPNLRLFDTGTLSKGLVDFVDARTGDALSYVAGQYNYYPDTNVYTTYSGTINGVVAGTSTTITIDKNNVTGTFAVGQYIKDIYQTPTVSVIPNNATITSITGTTTLTITVSWSSAATFTTKTNVQLVATDDPLSSYQLFDGAKIVFVNDSNTETKTKIYVVNFETVDTSIPPVITLTEVPNGQILEDNQFTATRGALYTGRTFYLQGTEYLVAQEKSSINQAPLFDVFDNAGISFSNTEFYPGSSFVGCKLFNYGVDVGVDDPILGFPIRYSSIDNVGDISFDVSLNSDTFNYVINTNPITTNVNTGYVLNYSTRTDFTRQLGWQTSVGDSVQYQVFEFDFDVTRPTSSFVCDVPLNAYSGIELKTKVVGEEAGQYAIQVNDIYLNCLGRYAEQSGLDYWVELLVNNTLTIIEVETLICSSPEALDPSWKNTPFPSVKVFINNEFQLPNSYTVTTNTSSTTIQLIVNSATNTKVQVLLLSNVVSENAYYTIPINLSNNPFNTDITTVNIGDIRSQYQSIFYNTPNITGQLFGANNFRDLGNLVPYGTSIIQNSSSLASVGSFLRLQNHNLFDALLYNSRQYITFKTLLVDTVAQITMNQTYTPSSVLDNALDVINGNKTNTQSFFWSDMIPNKNAYITNSYTFNNDFDTSIFPLSKVYNFTSANYDGVLVYVFRTQSGLTVEKQLVKGLDYTISTDSPSLTVTFDLLQGDVVTVKEYNQTYGSYVPNTPTKLGLYPSFEPKVILNSSYQTPTYFILGHDGSYNKLYGTYNDAIDSLVDFRDQALLEFEKRVYNNLKLSTEVLLRDYEILPGFFRDTTLSVHDFLTIYSEMFLNWVGANRLEYKTQLYNANNEFSYNYWQSGNKINDDEIFQGFWRGINLYFYDTSTPNKTPWEMLGLTSKPSWWETRYGPSPYTSDNFVLWNDLAQGIVWNNGNPYVVQQAIRPNLLDIIPVDSAGNLLSPLSSVVGNFTESLFKREWKVGDVAPVEYSYRKSSTWPFDLMRIFALTKPAEFFNLGIDLDNYKYVEEFNQYLVNDRSHLVLSDVQIYGNGVAKTSYINWIVDYEKQVGINATSNITNLLKNLDVRLVYRLAGYSDKTFLKFFVEKGTPNSVNASLLIPDESYALLLYENQPFNRIVYSSVVVQIVNNGYAVYGNSQNIAYFTILNPINNGNVDSITVENVSVRVANDYSNNTSIVPYGTVFNTVQELSQFLASYGAYLQYQGLLFDEIENGLEINVRQLIGEFLYWSQTGWELGNIITINAAANKLYFNKDSNIVQPLTIQRTNFVLNQNLYPIQLNDLSIERDQTEFIVKPLNRGDAISYAQFNVSNFEHGVVFDNITLFDDVIYNLVTGLRQDRILLKGVKTAAWNGTVTASGFILNQDNITEWDKTKAYTKGEIVKYKNKYWTALKKLQPSAIFDELGWKETDYNEIQKGLLPNSSTRSYESALYYNVNQANLEQDSNLLAYSLIGYRPRDYLSTIDLTDTAQVQVYKNFIRNKGSRLSVDTFRGAQLPQGGINYDVYENWAIKTADFGGTLNDNFFEVRLSESLLTGNPSILSLTNGVPTIGAQQYVPLYQIYNYITPIININVLPTIESYTPSELYPTAGFVNFNDVKMSSYFYGDLPNAVNTDNVVVPITDFYVGDYVWLANFLSDWQVYGWQSIGRVVTMRGNLNGSTTIRFANVHNLSRLDPISIINFDGAANGYYFVTTVVNPYEVIINLTLDVNNNVLTGQGIVLKFTSHKVQNPSDIINLDLLTSEFVKNKAWVETDTNGGWAVYRKSLNYNGTNSFDEPNTINYGTSVAYDNSFGYLVGDSLDGKLYRYTLNTFTNELELTETITEGTSYGTSITYHNNFIAVSEPSSGSPKVYIYVTNTNSETTNNLIEIQTILNPGSSSNFGSSIDFSRDGNYLYISEIYNSGTNDRVYVYVKENVPLAAGYFVPGQVYTITSVGTTDFTTIGSTDNLVGITFVATGVGTGTGTANQITYRLSPYNNGYVVAPTNQIDFGYSVATDYNGDTLIVGAPSYDFDINTNNTGRSYVYNRTTQQYEVQYNSILFGYQQFSLGWTPNQASTTVISTTGINDKILCNYTADVIIPATSIVPGLDYKILSVGSTSFTSIGASSNTVGVTFTATSVGTGTGKVYRPLQPVIFKGNLLDSLVQQYKVYFVDTIEEAIINTTFTITIKEDRNSSTVLNIDSAIFATLPYAYFQTNDLQVVKNGVVVQNSDYGVVIDKFVFTAPLLAGDLLSVGDSKLNFIQTLEPSNTPTIGSSYGYSVDTTRYGSELLIGAPYDLNNQTQEGSVYRYTNAGGKYGLIIGTNTVSVSAQRKIYLNGFEVIIPAPTGPNLNASDVANIINSLQLPNIQAVANNGMLMIGIIDSNLAVPNEKLLLTVYDNAVTTLNELGINIYNQTQIILCPHPVGATQFGSSIKFNDFDSVVIGAPVGTRYIFTSFDFTDDENFENDTVFDNNATQFVDDYPNAGAVYMYDYLPAYNESLSNPGNFVYAQSVNDTSSSFGPSPRYGSSVDFNEYSVIVGSPNFSSGSVDGKVNIFNNSIGVKDWAIYRSSSQVVDIERIQNIQIYDVTTNNTLVNLDYIDPLQGKILGAARQNLDYISNIDPAKYNSPDSEINGMVWGPQNVGQLWFDTNNVRFVNYHQNDVKYNSKYWGTVFPGSDVAVYSWVASTVPPNAYVGPGTVYDPTLYVIEPTLNAANQLGDTYYFWVRDTNIIFTQTNKTLADSVVASYIQNPLQSGISYFEPLLPNTFGLYNIQQYLNDVNSILHVGYTTGRSSDVPHSEYTLVRSNFADDFLPGVPEIVTGTQVPIYDQEPTGLYARLLASLSGVDSNDQVVPDFYLPPAVQSGIEVRPRQSFFYDRLLALKNYIQYANTVVKQFPIMEIKPDLSLLYRSFSLGTKLTTTVNNTLADYYADLVNNIYVECLGRYADQGGLDFWVEILVSNTLTLDEVRGLICSSPEALIEGRRTPYDVTNYWTTINWWAPGYDDNTKAAYQVSNYADLATLSVPRGTIVLVGQNVGSQEFYIYEPNLSVGTELSTTISGANATTYATIINEVYLTCLGRYAEQAGLDYWVNVLVNGLATLNEVESYICSSPEAITRASNPNWRRIGLQNGTIEFSEYLYDYPAGRIGFGDNFFDVDDFDEYPSRETYFIIRALCEQIYTEDLLIFRNKSLILLFDFIQAETIQSQNYLPWLNKTSLVDVSHTLRELLPFENFKTDNQVFLENYINEVKPYHVVIKDFLLKYTGTEFYEGNVTDFDLPSQYSVGEQQFITPMLVYNTPTQNNQYLPTSIIWDTVPYKQWFQNKGLSLTTIDNYPATLLDSYVDTSSSFLYVDNVYGFPTTGVIQIDNEQIGYYEIDTASNKVSQLVRGLNGTEIAVHLPNTMVYLQLPEVSVVYGGRGYTEPPRITVEYDTSIYPAPRQYIQLEPVMDNDVLLSVNVINPGQGYMTAPVINVEPSLVVTFSSTDVNSSFSVIRVFAPDLQTGDLVQYKNVSGNKIGGLIDNQWYYINVLAIQPSGIIGLYTTLEDATLDNHRVEFYDSGTGTNTLNLGARVIPTTTSSPTRELSPILRFDRTSYRPQVTDWVSGSFYAGEIASSTGLVSYASSSVTLESTLPPINNIFSSISDVPLIINNVSNDRLITYSEFARRVVGTNSGSNTVVLLPYDDGAGFSTASGSTFGFTIGMPIIFQGPLQGGIVPNTTYYVASIVSDTTFTISEEQFGPTFTLTTSSIPVIPGAKAYAGTITDTAVLDVYYPRIQQVTQVINNRVYSIPTPIGTGGTNSLYSGVSLLFTGTQFSSIIPNENYFVSAVFDDESFTISHSENTVRATISQTTSSTNIITVNNTDGFSFNDPVVFTNFVFTSGNFVVGQTYTILSLGTTDFTLLGSPFNTVGQKFVATASGTVLAGGFIPGLLYTIKSVGSTDFTLVGAISNTVGVKFIATGAGSGSGTATQGNGTASTTTFGGISSGTFYYISAIVSSTQLKISTSPGAGDLTLTNQQGTGYCYDQSLIDTLPNGTGNMTMMVALPISPGIVNGQEFTLYPSTKQYPNLTATNTELWGRTINATIGSPDSTVNKIALGKPSPSVDATDYVYINMPLRLTGSSIGGLSTGVTYYIIDYSGYVNPQTGLTTPSLKVDVTQTVAPNTLSCITAEDLYVGMPIVFSEEGLGGVSVGVEYFVNSISYTPGNNSFTISATEGGPAVTVTNDTGIMRGVGEQFIKVSTSRAGTSVSLSQALGPQTIGQNTATLGVPEFSLSSILGGYRVIITNQGSGYTESNLLTISGTAMGGISPDNDCTIYVSNVDSFGEITNVIVSGTPPTISNDYYVKTIGANQLALYSDPLLTIPVVGQTIEVAGSFTIGQLYTIVSLGSTNWNSIGYIGAAVEGGQFVATGIGTGTGTASVIAIPYNGLTTQTVEYISDTGEANRLRLVDPNTSFYQVYDQVFFSGNVGGGLLEYVPYYIHSITSDYLIRLSDYPGGPAKTLTTFDTDSEMYISKLGSIAYKQAPLLYNQSLVRYNNNVYECLISNNDDEFVIGKWELVNSDSRKLNALDRVVGYYSPTINMPGINLPQLMTGLEYPNTTYYGNQFNPAYQFTVETNLQGQEFIPYGYTNTSVINDGTDILITTNTANNSGLFRSADSLAYDIENITVIDVGFTDIVYSGTKYIITTTDSSAPIIESTDGVTWNVNTNISSLTSEPINSIMYYNGKYVAVGEEVYTSTNGNTWTVTANFSSSLPVVMNETKQVSLSSTNYYGVVGSAYVVSGTQYEPFPIFLYSTNATTWSGSIPDSRYFNYSLASNGTVIVGVGQNGIISRSTDLVNWYGVNETFAFSTNVPSNYLNVTSTAGFQVGDSVRFSSAFDVINTTTTYTISNIISSTQLQLTAVTFLTSPTVSSYMYLYPQTSNLNSVQFANGKFIAVGDVYLGEGLIKVSTDSLSWSIVSSNVPNNLNSIIYDSVNSKWVVVGDNNVILTSSDNGVTWDKEATYDVPEPIYTVQGDSFLSGYGPEEMIPGIVEDNLTIQVNTRPGTNWDATLYQHVGYNVVSNVYTPSPSNQVIYSFANLVEIPAQLALFVIDGATGLSTSIYVTNDYTVDWIAQTVTLNSTLTVGDQLRIDVYEVGNGDQLVKSNTFIDPIRTDDNTGFDEIYLNCNYSKTITNGSGLIQDLPYVTNVNCTQTESTYNTITVDNVSAFTLNATVRFQGTVFGNIVADTNYYVKFINTATSSIVISATISSGIAGPVFALSNATGNMTAILSSGAGVLWTDPYVQHNGDRLLVGRTNVALATRSSTNTVVVSTTGGLNAGDTIIFDDNMFGVVTPQTSYNILNIVDGTKFRLEDPLSPGNPLTLTNATGRSVFVTNDYAIGLQPNGVQAKVVFASQYDASTDYLAYSFFGETEPEQYGYTLPETEVFTATAGQTVFTLSNYSAYDNETDAIVEVNGLRVSSGYTIDFATTSLTFVTPLSLNDIVAVTTFNQTFRQYLNTQFDIQGLVVTISSITTGPNLGAQVNLSATLGLSNGDAIRFGGVTGTSQINDRTLYVSVVSPTSYELFTDPGLDAADAVSIFDAYTGTGFAWNDRTFTLTTATTVRTFATVNRIGVSSIDKLVPGTPVYFTSLTTVNGDSLVGGIVDNDLYWILEVGPSITAGSFIVNEEYIIEDLGTTNWNAIGYVGAPVTGGTFIATGAGSGDGTAFAKSITISSTQDGSEYVLTSAVGVVNISQFKQDDVDRLWVTVNGYRVPSDKLQVYNNNFVGIEVALSNVSDYVTILSMMPSATPNNELYFNNVFVDNTPNIYRTAESTTTWLTEDITDTTSTITIYDASKLLQDVESTQTVPALANNAFTLQLTQNSNKILGYTLYNNTLAVAIPNNIVTQTFNGNQPILEIENNPTYIAAGNSVTITMIIGGLIYVNGEQIKFTSYNLGTNEITGLTRGVNVTPTLTFVEKYTRVYAIFDSNLLGPEYYDTDWNSTNTYDTDLTMPLQISNTYPAEFLKSGM